MQQLFECFRLWDGSQCAWRSSVPAVAQRFKLSLGLLALLISMTALTGQVSANTTNTHSNNNDTHTQKKHSTDIANSTTNNAAPLRFSSRTQQTQLIELYTSEGCSSCPPADRWLGKLKSHPSLWRDYVPVAFHVDYWDYIGWKDPFAKPEFSVRQRYYAHKGNSNSVYTPQFMVGGKEWRGYFYRSLGASLPEAKSDVGVLALTLSAQSGSFSAQFTPTKNNPALQQAAPYLQLHIAHLNSGIDSKVSRGENRGRNLPHEFVVAAHRTFAAEALTLPLVFSGQLPGSSNHPQPSSENHTLPTSANHPPPHKQEAVAVWLTDIRTQAVIQATGGWLVAP